MLASFPASMVNQNRSDLGILNRFNLTPSRSRSMCPSILWQFTHSPAVKFAEALNIQQRKAQEPRNVEIALFLYLFDGLAQ